MKRTKPLASALALAVYGAGTMAENTALEEIVVTATKRAESLQDVPVAVTALTTNTIEAMGIVNTADLTRASASLTSGQGPTPNSAVFRVRGIGTIVGSVGIEPSVAVVIDEVSQAQSGQALTNLVDIERIEVLRGPQSTLFGKNASAGLLNFITKSPTDEFEGFIETTITDDDEQKVSGVVSGPLTQGLGYRVAAYYRDYDGWAENLFTGEDINGAEQYGVRVKLAWQASDTLDFLLIGHYYEDDNNCCSLSHRELDPSASLLGLAPVTETNPRTLTSQGKKNTDPEIDVKPLSEAEDTGTSLHINWAIGDFELTSISSYNNWENKTRSDLDFSPYPILEDVPITTLPGGVVANAKNESDYITQELRLSSPTGDRFDYLVGLYYADVDIDRQSERNFRPTEYIANTGTESMAAFGQLTWRLPDDTQLTLGGRYNYEEISVDFDNRQTGERYKSDDSEDRWLGKLALQHFVDEDTMLYASAANGYKGQGYDISGSFNQRTADNPVGAEDSRSFEVGVKSTLLDQRLQLNVVGFYTQYDDYQAQNSEVIDEEVVLVVTNVGQLETKGVEIDANFLVGRGLMFNSSIAWIDAVVEDYPDADCYRNQTVAQGCVPFEPGSDRFVQDLSGEPLNNSPDWKITVGARYFQPLESMPFDGFVNVNYQWQDEIIFDLKQNPGTVQDSYGIANISAGIRERSGIGSQPQYQVTLFVNNVFDQDYAAAIVDLSELYLGDTAYVQLVPRNAERYAGIRLKYSF
jgi:iron complex outermembrane receptor protein